MIRDRDNSIGRSIERETSILYEYLAECAVSQPPEMVINQIGSLFSLGNHENTEIVKVWEKIIVSPQGQQQFGLIANHCFYLILDRWAVNRRADEYVEKLITVFDSTTLQKNTYDRRKSKLRQLVREYQKSELYFKLKILAKILTSDLSENLDREAPVSSLVARYSYLYQFFLPEAASFPLLKNLVKQLQANNQQHFEFQLSQYIIYRARLVQLAKMNLLSKGAGKAIYKVKNPTFLSDRDIIITIRQHLKQFEHKYTLLQLAEHFLARNPIRSSYQEFKRDLYQYLIIGFKPRNESYQFKHKLKQKIEQIFTNSNSRPLNNSLVLQTCRQLLSFLIVDSSTEIDSSQLAELRLNLGTIQTAVLLIKIILICPEAKPDLEKKLALLFTQYHARVIKDVLWLIKILEHLLIGIGIHLGKIDISIAKNI